MQASLAINRAALSSHVRIVLLDELKEPLRFATRFAVGQDPFDLAGFTASFATLSNGLAQRPAQALIFSCEGLSGRTPGKNGITDYAAAIPLAGAIETAMRAVFGGKVDLTFLFTTRCAGPWLNSAWRHNLAGYRITDDFDAFCARYGKAADFKAITDQIAANLPRAKVIVTPLEQVFDHPAKAFFQLLDLPAGLAETLRNPGVKNAGISDTLATELLAINRNPVTDAEAKRLRSRAAGLAR